MGVANHYKDNGILVTWNSVPTPYPKYHLFFSVLGVTFRHVGNLERIQGRMIRTVKELNTVSYKESWYELQSLGWNKLEKEMATHSSTLAWKIPWTEQPGRLQTMGSQRLGHDGATSLTHSLKCKVREGCYLRYYKILWKSYRKELKS